jgi:hypothetical protein
MEVMNAANRQREHVRLLAALLVACLTLASIAA